MTEFFLQYWYWFGFGFWILLIFSSFIWLRRKYFQKETQFIPLSRPGYDALWLWFGLSRASFLTLPRVLLHEMPDDWQAQMAKLLNEFEDYWNPGPKMGSVAKSTFQVNIRKGSRNLPMTQWIKNYRHPDKKLLESFKAE